MKQIALRWLLVLLVALSTLSIAPGPAMAGDVSPCIYTNDPFVVSLQIDTSWFKAGAQVDYKVLVSNCTTESWSGNVRVEVSPGPQDGCVRDGYLSAPASVGPGESRTVSFRGEQPSCLGLYTVTATAYDTVDRAHGVWYFTVANKPPKTRP